jgi:hypothetical protein
LQREIEKLRVLERYQQRTLPVEVEELNRQDIRKADKEDKHHHHHHHEQ